MLTLDAVLGAMSKALATIVTQPLIVAKVRLQSKPPPERNGKPFKSFSEVLAYTVQHEGWLSLFKGIGPQLIKGIAVQGLLMMTKERYVAILGWTMVSHPANIYTQGRIAFHHALCLRADDAEGANQEAGRDCGIKGQTDRAISLADVNEIMSKHMFRLVSCCETVAYWLYMASRVCKCIRILLWSYTSGLKRSNASIVDHCCFTRGLA